MDSNKKSIQPTAAILHVYDKNAQGGVMTIVNYLISQNIKNIFFLCLRTTDVVDSVANTNSIHFESRSNLNPFSIFKLVSCVVRNSITTIHTHQDKSLFFSFLIKLCYFKNITLIHHEHGAVINGSWYYALMLKMVKSRVNLFIAVSEAVKNSLVSAGVDAVRITVLQNFVDTKKFNPYKSISVRESFRALYKIDQNDFVFGFAGRIIERKGWFEFVTAAKDVIDVNPTAKFFVAGDGPEMKQMKTLISQLNIDDNFVCPGKIKDIKLFYSAIDVFVLSSYWEGMPMVQLEAFAMGVPLVSSNGPGMNELAVDNVSCLYVPIKDSAALSKQLISLMNDEELLKKLSNEGFEISNKHSLDNYLSKLWFIYNSL